MVTVELYQVSENAAKWFHNGKRVWIYKPVNSYSFGEIGKVNYGYHWFLADEYHLIKEKLKERGVKITNRWYHIKTKRESGF